MDVLQQFQMLLLVGGEEFFGGFLHIQRAGNAARGLQHGKAAGGVQLGQFNHHRLQLAGKQVHRLAFEVFMAARGQPGFAGLGVLALFDPIPLALAGLLLPVGKNQQVFGMAVGNVLPHAQALALVRPAAIHHHLNGDYSAQLRHRTARKASLASLVSQPIALCTGAVPAQHINK